MNAIRLILLSAVIFPLFASSQTNYKEGYVINEAGDTLKGFINYLEWYNNPEKISFKPAPGNIVMDITTANAKQVTITGFDTYQRFEVTISMNSLRFEETTEATNDSSVTKTVFLKQLLQGNHLNMYSYVDKMKTRFYILDRKKNTPEELLYVRKLEGTQEQTLYPYRRQLVKFAVEYSTYTTSLENKIRYADYNETSLKNIVSKINTDNENKTKATGNVRLNKNSGYFIGLGIMQATIKYTGQDLITSDRLDENGANKYKNITTKNITPRIAAGINFYSKQWLHRLGVKTEISGYRFASTIVSYTKYNRFTPAENEYTFHLNGWSFTVTPQLIYKFYSSYNIKAYISSGLGLNLLTTSRNSIYKVGYNQPLTFNETTNDYLVLKSFNLSATARAGVLIKDKVDIYIYGSSPVQYNSLNAENFSVKSGVLAFCAAYNF
ncbi:MAG: hypothetical protein ABIN97_18530 [Ginsengibacter sp.]